MVYLRILKAYFDLHSAKKRTYLNTLYNYVYRIKKGKKDS